MTTLAIATLNVHHRRTDAAIRRDITAIVERGCDVIALQEMGGHAGAVADIPGFGVHMPTDDPRTDAAHDIGPASVPILWRHDTCRMTYPARPRLIHGPEDVPDKAAGPSTVGAKYANRVRLQHKSSGQVVHVVNSHAVASNYLPGVRPLFDRHMEVIGDIADRHRKDLVLLAGDYNATIRDGRFTKPLGVADLISNWESATAPDGGTKGPRAIDHILYIPNPRMRVTAQETVKLGSDHRSLIVTFALA